MKVEIETISQRKHFNIRIYNSDCIEGARKHFNDKTIDLIICDPPFGIDEHKLGKQYNRDKSKIIPGYVPAPLNYHEFSLSWITEAKRILKDSGSMYIVSGFNNLLSILDVLEDLGMYVVNHLIWKYSFGVNTFRKYVTSHYTILYVTKSKNARPTFNTYCRFTAHDKDENEGSQRYQDMEDVWYIQKDYHRNKIKNINKLPDELIQKIIQYSSNPGDMVCDFFMGNFTTAFVAKRMGRHVCGFELNKNAYDFFIKKSDEIEFGCDLLKGKAL